MKRNLTLSRLNPGEPLWKSLTRTAFERVGLRVLGRNHYLFLDGDIEPEFKAIYQRNKPFTLTTFERVYALYNAVRHIADSDVPGAVVECGVWRGGSMMVCAETLLAAGCTDRALFLYDTFQGMSKPTDKDVTFANKPATGSFEYTEDSPYAVGESRLVSLAVSLEQVRQNMARTGYPPDRMVFVEGKVEDTIPGTLPDSIVLLRLDTDWYESTYHELVHLFPRLVPGGVLIVDDYGHWRGAREAVDQYFAENGIHMLLHRVDYSCRIGIKSS